mmetsp:Transcript_42247/g.64762  ORF Transcript_42247/g.64762 Transcript_42247/m.64762 type:complete len:106 (-) Transcript_42247:46-363(-)
MIMEHFELHKEQLEDIILDLEKNGQNVFIDIPAKERNTRAATADDFALLDEVSGLTNWLDNFMAKHDLPETTKDRIKSYMFRYEGKKEKTEALAEIRDIVFGGTR